MSAADQRLAELQALDRAALAQRWRAVFGVPAPKSCQATLLRQGLAWHAQMGTRLLREWQGRTHHMAVVEGGFEYDGRVWTSLSAIARHITGHALVRSGVLRGRRVSVVPCAVYTSKSSEEGLEQGFNSLDAQREALPSLHPQPESVGLEGDRLVRRRRLLRRARCPTSPS